MDIELRPIQSDSVADKENYFALQKSVALFPQIGFENKKENENWLWQDLFKNKNKICYVIEKLPEHSYCGECAVKNICVDTPEIEIELMKEYQNQGIGYQSILIMLNKLAKEYGKENFYARIEPDNYVSQFLVEKLGGVPVGISKDCKVSDEREEQYIKEHRDLLDETIQKIAEKFGVKAELLLTHVLVYKLNITDLNLQRNDTVNNSNKKGELDCSRKISKEKYIDTMKEWLEDLKEIKDTINENEDMDAKLEEIKNKILNRVDKMEASCIEYVDTRK